MSEEVIFNSIISGLISGRYKSREKLNPNKSRKEIEQKRK